MDTDSKSGERVETSPKFMQALRATEDLLVNSDEEFWGSYFSNSSKLPNIAQSFDLIAGPNQIEIQGDSTSLRIGIATELRRSIDDYQGPIEVKQIYEGLYKEDIRGILGE